MHRIRPGGCAFPYAACVLALTLTGCGSNGNGSGFGASGSGGRSGGGSGSGSGASGGSGDFGSDPDAGSCSGQGCACPTLGATQACWTGPPSMRNVGACHDGVQICKQEGEVTQWGPCDGEVLDCGDGGNQDGAPRVPVDAGADGAMRVPPAAPLCALGGANDEPEILVGFSTTFSNGMVQIIQNQTVSMSGEVRVWVNDECPPSVAPGEQADPNTGTLTPGNRNAQAPDGYLWEPALYIGPQWAENGGMPHFPQRLKGAYDNNPANFLASCGPFANPPQTSIAPDPPPGTTSEMWTCEDIWDVSSLGLPLGGPYALEIVIHDGDTDRGVGCIMLTITP